MSSADPNARLNFVFDLLVVLFGWVFHPIWIVPVLALSVAAAVAAVGNYGRYVAEVMGAVDHYPKVPLLTFELIQTLLMVNLPRTVLGGMAVRRFGGRVTAFGFKLLGYLVPTFYYEAYALPALKSDRGKWTILSIDVWARLGMGSVVILSWYASKPYTTQSLFWAGLIAACVLGLFYHCVIFFEQSASYWMLCHAVDDPRVRERALAETHAWLGARTSPEALTGEERYWLRAYGLGFYLFRLAFDLVLLVGVGQWLIGTYKSVGAMIYLTGILWAYRDSLWRAAMSIESFRWVVRGGGDWRLRWAARVAMLLGIVALGFLPYDYEVVGECRVIAGESYGIRARIEDEIRDVFVSEGDQVEPGTVIARLVGRKAKSDVAVLKADLDKSKANLDMFHNGYLPEDVAKAEEQVKVDQANLTFAEQEILREETIGSKGFPNQEDIDTWRRNLAVCRETLLSDQLNFAKLKKGYRVEEVRGAEADVRSKQGQYEYALLMLEQTEVLSPVRGRVVSPYMQGRRGQPVSVGDLIATIQDMSRMHAEVAADDASAIVVREGAPVKIRLYGTYGRLITGRVHTIAPKVEEYGKFGNSSIHTEKEASSDESANSRYRNSSYQLRIYVDLDRVPDGLTTDMTGYARIHVREDVLWRALARPVTRFLLTDVWSWLP